VEGFTPGQNHCVAASGLVSDDIRLHRHFLDAGASTSN
jgi:hypothetical protein